MVFVKPLFSFLLIILAWLIIPNFRQIASIKMEGDGISADLIGNAYIFNGPVLIKYSPLFTEVSRFSDKRNGEISSIDVTNPLKILVFYKENGLCLFLDNFLAPINRVINLNSDEFGYPQVICYSNNGGMWAYFNSSNELVRFDASNLPVAKTGSISQLISYKINPVSMRESGNLVYLMDPELGIFIFDVYGTYVKRLPFKNNGTASMNKDSIMFINKNHLYIYNSLSLDLDSLILPVDTPFLSGFNDANKFFFIKGDSVKIFQQFK